jgi:hypothetical protein
MWPFISKKLRLISAAVLSVLLVLGAAFLKGRSRGVEVEKTKSLKKEIKEQRATNETIRKTNEIEVGVGGLPDSDIRQRLQDRWTRD